MTAVRRGRVIVEDRLRDGPAPTRRGYQDETMSAGYASGYASLETPKAAKPIGAGLLASAIVQTVAYADGFDYPLTADEIHRYLVGHKLQPATVAHLLGPGSPAMKQLSQRDGYYMLRGRESLVDTRLHRAGLADRLWPEAVRYARTIEAMPFVRMVAVTGSLAVGNVDTIADIDYLIVTANDRLWICRAFVIATVRMAAQRGIELCPNYLLAERAMTIGEHDLYTAHEIAQMVPLAGMGVYSAFREANAWTARYLPNAGGPPQAPAAASSIPFGRWAGNLLEGILATSPGRHIDRAIMNARVQRFRGQQQNWSESCFTPDCCKGHFNLHRLRALKAYEQRLVNPSL